MFRQFFLHILSFVCIVLIIITAYYASQNHVEKKAILTVVPGKVKNPTPTTPPQDIVVVQPLIASTTAIEVTLAQTPTPTLTPKPTPSLSPKPSVVSPTSAISVYVDPLTNSVTVLSQTSPNKVVLIASITKLMTAVVALKHIPENRQILISNKAVEQLQDYGNLKAGQVFTRNELLYPLLIESSNDAAYAFAEEMGTTTFVSLMNEEAVRLGMKNTRFRNPSGFDFDGGNTSTANDLVLLARYIFVNHPFILEVTRHAEYHLITQNADYNHVLKNTNETLRNERVMLPIIGGKTGETVKAKQNLLLINRLPGEDGYLVNIVLGSVDRDADMIKLIEKVLRQLN